jgi:hypothetical protein
MKYQLKRLKQIAKRAIRDYWSAESLSRAKNIYAYVRNINAYIRLQPSNAYIRFQLLSCKSLEKLDVLFFYDRPRHWPTIKLVVEELVHRRSDLRLALVIACSKKEFPDDSFLSGIPIIRAVAASLVLFDTQILYTPTPYLSPSSGDPSLRAKIPPKARVVHALMSMNSLDGTFADDAFDAYDYILCAGPYQLDSFRKRAVRYPALSRKWLLPAGYPKLDLILASHSTKRHSVARSGRSTVVYAPTHNFGYNENLTSLRQHGEAIINALLAEGHRVIFRPHPISLVDSDRPDIDRICRLHGDNPNFSLDASADYAESYSMADLMVTDVSGTGFMFSFSFGKPCLFFAPDAEAERGLSGIQFDARHRIGALVRDIDELIGKTAELCHRDMTEEIARFRDETVFNVGKSASYIVDCLEDILSGCERPEWDRL